jgi:hypothetical protein
MAEKRIMDRGLEALAAAADDPFARFALKALTPLAKKGLDEVEGAVRGAFKRVRDGLDPEGEPVRVKVKKGTVRANVDVIDAEIIEDTPKGKG